MNLATSESGDEMRATARKRDPVTECEGQAAI